LATFSIKSLRDIVFSELIRLSPSCELRLTDTPGLP
jgi:hypothetical protein